MGAINSRVTERAWWTSARIGSEPHKVPIISPWRLPECLSRAELLGLLWQARARRQRDWPMILVTFWHRLSTAEVTGFTKEAIQDGSIKVQRVRSGKITIERLVRYSEPLLDERDALVDFVEKAPPGQPVFNVTRNRFWQLMQQYGKAAGIPRHKTTPRALRYSVAVQSLLPINVDEAKAAVAAAQAEVKVAEGKLGEAEAELKKLRTKAAKDSNAAKLARRKTYLLEDITKAIESVRKTPFVTNRTAMVALNISESEFYRWLEHGKLKKYKKGFVYSGQVVRTLDREQVERNR